MWMVDTFYKHIELSHYGKKVSGLVRQGFNFTEICSTTPCEIWDTLRRWQKATGRQMINVLTLLTKTVMYGRRQMMTAAYRLQTKSEAR